MIEDLVRLRQELADSACRGALLVSGEKSASEQLCADLLPDLEGEVLLIGSYPLADLQPAQRKTVLGRECQTLIWNLHSQPDINTLAASAGCLCRGGLLLILAPEPDDWVDSFSLADGSPSLFWQHILSELEQWPYLAQYSLEAGFLAQEMPFPALAAESDLPTADQVAAMHRVGRVLHGHRRRPLVIRADRGRGKSTLLGLSAAEFLLEDRGDIVITAPRKEAAATALQHAAQRLGTSGETLSSGSSSLRFMPPDRLLDELPEARMVLVDEAAAIPPALLEKIVRHYARVVFASTVHGYEGSGRGFDIRFTETLNALTPQWQSVELQEPVRWSEGDPLEALINRLFLLDAAAPEPAPAIKADQCEVVLLDKLHLLNDNTLLREVFGLLVVAHYQTTPSDLHHLLDSLATSVWVLRSPAGRVCAAALVIEEGGLPAESFDAVLQGERRLQGHLLPQSLVYHCGLSEGLELRCARISRIAVLAEYRRRGLGQRLLQAIEHFASAEGLDYVGSSFAADTTVTGFWLQQDYLPLRLGVRRDPCSGSHALLVAKPFTERASNALTPLYNRFGRHFCLQLRETYQALDAALALILLNQSVSSESLGKDEWRDVQRFVSGEIAFEHAYPSLFRYLQSGPLSQLPEGEDTELIISRVLQAQGWTQLARRCALTGRREVEHRLRQGYRLFLSLEQGQTSDHE
ncbi:MAG: hypothetical protein CMN84_02635 [Spongiibacteraceae bacterium]|nr:hypothetical protein [Spongiibacteraceae bacterium]